LGGHTLHTTPQMMVEANTTLGRRLVVAWQLQQEQTPSATLPTTILHRCSSTKPPYSTASTKNWGFQHFEKENGEPHKWRHIKTKSKEKQTSQQAITQSSHCAIVKTRKTPFRSVAELLENKVRDLSFNVYV